MENKKNMLNREVQSLREELYSLLENEPWANQDILRISNRLDELILKFYNK